LNPTPRQVAARLPLYVGLALAVLLACGLVTWALVATGLQLPPRRWGAFAVFTPFVFWFVVRQSRRHWRRASFWLAAAGLLACHIGLFALVLTEYPEWPPVWFAPVSIVEVGILSVALDRLFARRTR
jgi:hypothetical protein